jgi:hypothetical protein
MGVTARRYPRLSDKQRAKLANMTASASLAAATASSVQASMTTVAAGATDLLGGDGAFNDNAGTLKGWMSTSITADTSRAGWYPYKGGATPLNGNPVPVPFSAPSAAVADMLGASSPMLYKNFNVPLSVSSANLTFRYYYFNYEPSILVPNPLTTLALPSQEGQIQFAMVDIVRTDDVKANKFVIPSSGEFFE